MSIIYALQDLGSALDLMPMGDQPLFSYPEHATITALISDGISERNALVQSGSLTLRQKTVTFQAVPYADMVTIRGYASSKNEVAYTDEDGTSRNVIVMDFAAKRGVADVWFVTVRLIETDDPNLLGS